MKFLLVNGWTPRTQSLCALCCESIGESYAKSPATVEFQIDRISAYQLDSATNLRREADAR